MLDWTSKSMLYIEIWLGILGGANLSSTIHVWIIIFFDRNTFKCFYWNRRMEAITEVFFRERIINFNNSERIYERRLNSNSKTINAQNILI